MKDIQNKQDIELLVDEFYKKVVADPIIGRFFTEVVHLSWDIHIPIMVSFWETILLGKMSYKGNPMIKHIELNKLMPMEPTHFERWISLWSATINENFMGSKATEAIARAKAIAGLIQNKISLQH
jgi:hemoglobin